MDQQRPGAETPPYDTYTVGSQNGSQAGSQMNLPAAGSSGIQLRSSTQVTLVETATEPANAYNAKGPKGSSTPTLDSQKEEQYYIPQDLSRHTSPAISPARTNSRTDTENADSDWSFEEQLRVSTRRCVITFHDGMLTISG